MLASGNQYLRPEYLSPLPTTLDAKKSPLALLAQTCSNIGADNPNNKPIIPGLEKAKDPDKIKESKSSSFSSSSSNSSSCDDKSSFKPYVDKKEDSEDGHKKTPNGSKSGSPVLPTGSCSPAAMSCGKASPANSLDSNLGKSTEAGLNSTAESTATPPTLSSSSVNSGSQSTLSSLGYGNSIGLDLGRLDHGKDGLTAMTHLALGAYKHGSALNSLANCVGCGPGHLPVDGSAVTTPAFASGLGSQSSSPLKPGYSPLSPYLGYARVKSAIGGTALVPVCRDPFCTNCQFSIQSAQLTVCPSGCSQCNHDRLPVMPHSPLSGLGAAGLVPGLQGPASPAGGPPGLPSPLYPHSMLARPNVCSWMVGDTYCGKRFTTSEDLLQHLRTHTNLTASDNTLPLLSPGLPPPPHTTSAGWSAACHMHYSTAASLSTQAGLRRAYPTSLSPVSSLSATGRYHPYKAPVPTFPGAPLPPLPHPGLGLYYSPYGIYGQRLGPPVHP